MRIIERRRRWIKVALTATEGITPIYSWIQVAGIALRVMAPNLRNADPLTTLPQIREFADSLANFIHGRGCRDRRTALAYSAFDVDCHAEWERGLHESGWVELSCAYRHRLLIDTYTPKVHPLFLRMQETNEVPLQILSEILPCIWSDSSDPLSDIRSRSLQGYLADIGLQRMCITTIIGFEGADPVGFLISGISEGSDQSTVGWILDVGVVPAYRLRGYGAALLARAIEKLRADKVTQVFSLIDEGNTPSLHLHKSQMFNLVDGPFRTFVLRDHL